MSDYSESNSTCETLPDSFQYGISSYINKKIINVKERVSITYNSTKEYTENKIAGVNDSLKVTERLDNTKNMV